MPSTTASVFCIADSEVVPPDHLELRSCPRCHIRLIGAVEILGQFVHCPECSYETRALAASGPIKSPSSRVPTSQRPTLPLFASHNPTLIVSTVAAPLPAARVSHHSLRSQFLIDLVGWLQIAFGGLYVVLIACVLLHAMMGEQFREWTSDGFGQRATLGENVIEMLMLGVLALMGFAMLSIASEIWDRTKLGWRGACSIAVTSTLIAGVVLTNWLMGTGNIRGSFAGFIVVLFSLSGLLTLGILLQPRFRRAFGRME